MLEKQTYSDPLVFVIDFYVVPFPGDGGLRVTAWRNTLHHSWLSCRYNHIARGLPEIISQNCMRERHRDRENQRVKFNSCFIGVNVKIKIINLENEITRNLKGFTTP